MSQFPNEIWSEIIEYLWENYRQEQLASRQYPNNADVAGSLRNIAYAARTSRTLHNAGIPYLCRQLTFDQPNTSRLSKFLVTILTSNLAAVSVRSIWIMFPRRGTKSPAGQEEGDNILSLCRLALGKMSKLTDLYLNTSIDDYSFGQKAAEKIFDRPTSFNLLRLTSLTTNLPLTFNFRTFLSLQKNLKELTIQQPLHVPMPINDVPATSFTAIKSLRLVCLGDTVQMDTILSFLLPRMPSVRHLELKFARHLFPSFQFHSQNSEHSNQWRLCLRQLEALSLEGPWKEVIKRVLSKFSPFLSGVKCLHCFPSSSFPGPLCFRNESGDVLEELMSTTQPYAKVLVFKCYLTEEQRKRLQSSLGQFPGHVFMSADFLSARYVDISSQPGQGQADSCRKGSESVWSAIADTPGIEYVLKKSLVDTF